MSNIKLVSLGCDPELFILAPTKEVLSSELFIPGDKMTPHDLENGYAVQKDNIMCEFNTPPCKIGEDFQACISKGIELVEEMLPPQLSLVNSPSVVLPKELKDSFQALEFGCEPDFNAYTGKENKTPSLNKSKFRFAGGHVHLGLEGGYSKTDVQEIIKCMDLFLGVPSILMDGDSERRKVYGDAGRFRYKDYGAEYRTLSNFWIKDKASFISDMSKRAVDFYAKRGALSSELQVKVRNTINNSDVMEAAKLCSEFEIES